MSNQKLVDEISKLEVPNNKLGNFIKRHHTRLYDEVVGRTSFLEDDISFMARIYCLKYNITSHPTCHGKNCSNPTEWNRETRSFRTYCCGSCRSSDENWQSKVASTNLIRHGDEHPSRLDKFKKKAQAKWMVNLGVDNPQKSQIVREKTNNTNNDRYGGPAPACSKEVLNKMQSTCKKRYDVENPFQLLPPRTSQSDATKEKIRNTWIGKTNEEVADIAGKREDTCLRRHGAVNPFQVAEFKAKSRESCRKRHGVDYYSQSIEYHQRKRHKFHSEKYPGLTFDSKWEVQVYEFCRDNDISVEYSPEVVFPYEYDGGVHFYHPDFRIEGGLYEVKGDNFFRVDETGHEVMFNPYRNPEWSDGRYAWECGKYEAKHQCMLRNGVVILREWDINNLTLPTFRVLTST